jgi:predicted phosphodiesterase
MNPPVIRRWIVSGDYQIPFHDVKALAVFEKYMANHVWDGYLHLGDLMDMDTISGFNKGKPGNVEGRYIVDDFAMTNKMLDRHQQIVWENNPYAKFVLLEGNHEERIDRFISENPVFKGDLDLEKKLRLKDRGFEWVRAWSKGEVFRIGKASFVHGEAASGNHAKKMAEKEDGSIFYGHTHDMICWPVVRRDKTKPHVGQSLGCMCQLEQSYMRGKPSNWQQGFGVFHFLADGTYTYYTPRIINGRFIGPDGVLYS